jgi:hypothetical protein
MKEFKKTKSLVIGNEGETRGAQQMVTIVG